jgi:hypothetical protein
MQRAALDAHQVPHAAAEETAAAAIARLPGIYAAWGRSRIAPSLVALRLYHLVNGSIGLRCYPFWDPTFRDSQSQRRLCHPRSGTTKD